MANLKPYFSSQIQGQIKNKKRIGRIQKTKRLNPTTRNNFPRVARMERRRDNNYC